MRKLTAPAGCTAFTTPVIVAVSVVCPPKVGLLDAARLINGICCPRGTVKVVEDALK